jgi:hypothetical protein
MKTHVPLATSVLDETAAFDNFRQGSALGTKKLEVMTQVANAA